MRALITNDDGITSPGLLPLAHAALAAGLEVSVAAPNREYSGAAAGLAGEPADDGGYRVGAGRPDGLDARAESMAVFSSPAMIAYGAAMGAFGQRPDLLLSGANLGPNVGPAVVHSGTVGAALTAGATGLPALAVSTSTRHAKNWDTVQWVIERVLESVDAFPTDGRVLNLNVPDLPRSQLKGLREAQLGRYANDTDEAADQVKMMLGGEAIMGLASQFSAGSDGLLLAQGWATVSVVQAPIHDVGDHEVPTFTL